MFRLKRRSASDYELLPRSSSDSTDSRHDFTHTLPTSPSPWLQNLRHRISSLYKLTNRAVYTHYVTPRRRKRSILRLLYVTVLCVPAALLGLALLVSIFFPSYTVRPSHYTHLRQRALRDNTPGRANPHNETVFIAASLYEKKGQLTSGAWGQAVLQLVDLLGPANVHLSLYEDNPDAETEQSMLAFQRKATCNATIVSEHLELSSLPRVTLPSGETRLKRIAFLAEVRNRALAPIDSNGVRFDKILYLNDVMFDPIEAAQLLLATNIDSAGRANYAAACAVDFILPFKFYDRFATRDLDGYITGVPFYPWFTSAGTATSRKDVMAGKDAVRVRSCWGGMVAFEAKWFQNQTQLDSKQESTHTSPNPDLAPLRFRYETDLFWDSSECCLIHADLQYRRTGKGMPTDSGIYMNPFIRVAYEESTLSWLSLSRRPEKLFALAHSILTYFVGFTERQYRLGDEPGSTVTDTVWVNDDSATAPGDNTPHTGAGGHYQQVSRVAEPGGYCGAPNLLVINEKPEHGSGKWGQILPPRRPGEH